MAQEESVVAITIEAGGDLSSHQYKFVVVATDGQVDLVGSAGADATGVLRNAPVAAGEPAEVAIAGRVKIELGGTVTPGMKLQSTAAGLAIEAASSDHVLGTCLLGGAINEVGEMLVQSNHILA